MPRQNETSPIKKKKPMNSPLRARRKHRPRLQPRTLGGAGYQNSELQMRANVTKPIMVFKHFTDTKWTPFTDPVDLGHFIKPRPGLLLSCGDALLHFDNGWFGSFTYEYNVTVKGSGLIVLDTTQKLIWFYDAYGGQRIHLGRGVYCYPSFIDWNRVRSQNPSKCGVYIPKFSSAASVWSDGWDFCSAILWSSACITDVQQTKPQVQVQGLQSHA